jgi:hypothetical protein
MIKKILLKIMVDENKEWTEDIKQLDDVISSNALLTIILRYMCPSQIIMRYFHIRKKMYSIMNDI